LVIATWRRVVRDLFAACYQLGRALLKDTAKSCRTWRMQLGSGATISHELTGAGDYVRRHHSDPREPTCRGESTCRPVQRCRPTPTASRDRGDVSVAFRARRAHMSGFPVVNARDLQEFCIRNRTCNQDLRSLTDRLMRRTTIGHGEARAGVVSLTRKRSPVRRAP